jgi:hypothetical protein
MGAFKDDKHKTSISLVPGEVIEEIARVMEFGSRKYSPHGWREGMDHSRLIDAALRHIYRYMRGVDKDEESGHSHISHAATNLMFLVYYLQHDLGKDDRYTSEDKLED